MKQISKDKLLLRVQTKFKSLFGMHSNQISFVPGRINIIGEHTDYNNGFALPTAIDKWIIIASKKNEEQEFNLYSLNYCEQITICNKHSNKVDKIWKKISSIAINTFIKKYKINLGANMIVGGNIPIGCGLSSSSAFVISIIDTMCKLFSIKIESIELAKLCQKIEKNAVGTAGGFLDQYGIILSKKNKFMMIDFLYDSIEYVPAIIKKCSWIIINSNKSRELSNSNYLNRVKECRKGENILKQQYNISSFRDIKKNMLEKIKIDNIIIYNRISHVLDENERVLKMKEYLIRGNAIKIGRILEESHESLKIKYQASCEEVDFIIDKSKQIDGWLGGRIMGGGFGGCSIHIIESLKQTTYINTIKREYKKKYGIILEVIKISFPGGLKN